MMLDWLTDDAARNAVDHAIVIFALVAARVLPIVELAPFLGGRAAPRTVKISVAFCLTVLVFPVVWSPSLLASRPGTVELASLVVKELLVGLTFGFVIALVFEAVRIAGQIIDAARGQTMANVMVPQLPERVSVTADYLYLLAVALFFAFGGHLLFVEALVRSYASVGLFEYPSFAGGATEVALLITRLWADAIAVGVLFAFPVVASVLLADLVLAFINRSAPQVNVFFLGMPLKAALGTAVVLLGLGIFADEFANHARTLLAAHEDIVLLLGS